MEDDETVLRVVKRILARLGYTVLVADSPQGALELVRERGETIDLLITDVVMPGMNGRELSEAVLALRPDMNCLFVSGYTRDVIASRGVLEEGCTFSRSPSAWKAWIPLCDGRWTTHRPSESRDVVGWSGRFSRVRTPSTPQPQIPVRPGADQP